MRNSVQGIVLGLLLAVGALLLTGCHADPDDPKGQANELSDKVRRNNALVNLQRILEATLVKVKGDRSADEFQKFVDVTIEKLVKTYLDNPADTDGRMKIVRLLQEMRDPRSIPVLIEALKWREEVTEDQAVAAANAIKHTKIPAKERGKLVAALCESLGRIERSRGVDNQMRKLFIEALGRLQDKGATDTLIKISLSRSEAQNFLFNILAAQQLVKIADPKSVPAMIKALYLFDPSKPQMRMNDVAAATLVAVGKPSLQPLIDTLQGKNEDANQLVRDYIQAIKRRDPDFAAKMNEKALISNEAAYALGKLGYREAIEYLIGETEADNENRKFGAAIALVSINREEADTAPILEAIQKVYDKIEPVKRPQLLVAVRHLYASEVMPWFLHVLKTYEFELSPIRLFSFIGYAMLANKAEMQELNVFLEKGPQFKQRMGMNFKGYEMVMASAAECDENIECWVGKLKHKENIVVRKAANTIARFGRGNEAAIAGLVAHLQHRDLEVRNEVLGALDYIAVKGSKVAVDKINEMEDKEAGRSIWNNFKREALPTRSRLIIRAGG
jgi:HEAT repeat protein